MERGTFLLTRCEALLRLRELGPHPLQAFFVHRLRKLAPFELRPQVGDLVSGPRMSIKQQGLQGKTRRQSGLGSFS